MPSKKWPGMAVHCFYSSVCSIEPFIAVLHAEGNEPRASGDTGLEPEQV